MSDSESGSAPSEEGQAGPDPELGADEARRLLLKLGVYVAPAVLGVMSVSRPAGAQAKPSCNPSQCHPHGGPCGPNSCHPHGGPCGPDNCPPNG
jgi:hypothetical protein